METWQWWAAGLAYWVGLVWSRHLRAVTWWLSRGLFVVVLVTLGRTGAGLREAVLTVGRWRRNRVDLLPLNGGNVSNRDVARAAAELCAVLRWDARLVKWRMPEWGRELVFDAADMPDPERVAVELCRRGVDAPIGRLTVFRDRYDNSGRVHIQITDRRISRARGPRATPPALPSRVSSVPKHAARRTEPVRTEPSREVAEPVLEDPYVAAITSGARTNDQIAQLLGRSKSTVSEALKRRATDGLIHRVGGHWHLGSAQ
jgi:hypothetical protein